MLEVAPPVFAFFLLLAFALLLARLLLLISVSLSVSAACGVDRQLKRMELPAGKLLSSWYYCYAREAWSGRVAHQLPHAFCLTRSGVGGTKGRTRFRRLAATPR